MNQDNDKKTTQNLPNDVFLESINKMTQKYAKSLKALAAGTKEEAEEIIEKEER